MKLKNNYYLLRHGEARSNKERFVSCWPEKIYNPLTSKGIKQIKELIPILKKEKIDFIFSSDLLRTKQTAEMIAKQLKLKADFDKRLREIKLGEFNGRLESDWNKFFKTPKERFTKRPRGGENYRDIKKRAFKFLEEINKKYKNKKILIISHGAILFVLEAITKGFNEGQEIIHRKKLIFKKGELRRFTISRQ
ncbi:MAG: histidine phosphatase family protein [Patescibacteria group bacterium]